LIRFFSSILVWLASFTHRCRERLQPSRQTSHYVIKLSAEHSRPGRTNADLIGRSAGSREGREHVPTRRMPTPRCGGCRRLSSITPLHLASRYGRTSVVQLLLQSGSRVDDVMYMRGATGVTALHLAVQAGNVELIDMLISAGSDVNISTLPL